MKILFFIRSLDVGGAERQLVLLAKRLRERGHDIVVALSYSGGPLEKELWDSGVRIRPLYKRGRWDIPGFLFRLAQMIREERPDILHGYLTDQNLMALLFKPLFPSLRIVWGVRCSHMDLSQFDWLSTVSFKLTCRLSRFADAIIMNSQVGREFHVSMGYPAAKSSVIPNGVDTARFRPDAGARGRIRSEWGVAEHERLIGLAGRLDPMKDHPCFLKAAALLTKKRTDTRFVCIGGGSDEYRTKLQILAESLGLGERLQWLGSREDMPDVYNALDIAVSSSSYGEGLSNAICEAMACGVPCVVTNVGDSAWVVGDMGEVVPPKDSVALMAGIEKLLDQKIHDPGQIRQRIVEQLSVNSLVANTEHTLAKLLQVSCKDI